MTTMIPCTKAFAEVTSERLKTSNASIQDPLILIEDRFCVIRNDGDHDFKLLLRQKMYKWGYCFYLDVPSKEELTYHPFQFDFGPVNLAMVYKFYLRMNALLDSQPYSTLVIVLPDSVADEANAAFLCGSFCVIRFNQDPNEIYKILTMNNYCYVPFKDAGFGNYTINMLDCLRGLYRAKAEKLLDFDRFNVNEYQFYEQVENGDLNWIVPEKLLAFKTPEDKVFGVYQKPPEAYYPFFRLNNIKLIVRLNCKTYDRKKFIENGFQHSDLYFDDGSSPSLEIVHKFLDLCEKTNGAIAVHCQAGLGRTGTLIACYLIKHYNFTSREAIAWARICRPGSVIGPQQTFLEQNERHLKHLLKKDRESARRAGRSKVSDDCLRCPESSEKLLNVQYEENKQTSIKQKTRSSLRSKTFEEKVGSDQLKKITSDVQQIDIHDKGGGEKDKHLSQGELLNLKKVHRVLKLSDTSESKRVTRSQTRLEQNQNQPPHSSNVSRGRISTDKYLKKKIATLVEKFKEAGDFESSTSKGLTNKSDNCWQKKLPICSVPIKELILRFDSNSNVEKRNRKLTTSTSSVVAQRTRALLFCKNRIQCSTSTSASRFVNQLITPKPLSINPSIANPT